MNYSPVKAKGDKSGCVCVGERLCSDGSTLWCVGDEFGFSGSQMGGTCVLVALGEGKVRLRALY